MRPVCIAFALVFFFTACKESAAPGKNGMVFKDAQEYNNFIIDRHTGLMRAQMQFGNFAKTNLDSATIQLGVLSKQVGQTLTDIKGMPPFKNDSALRDASIQSFLFYRRIFHEDYPTLIALAHRERDSADATARAEMNSIINKVIKDEQGFDASFQAAQQSFAEKNKLQLFRTTVE